MAFLAALALAICSLDFSTASLNSLNLAVVGDNASPSATMELNSASDMLTPNILSIIGSNIWNAVIANPILGISPIIPTFILLNIPPILPTDPFFPTVLNVAPTPLAKTPNPCVIAVVPTIPAKALANPVAKFLIPSFSANSVIFSTMLVVSSSIAINGSLPPVTT